MLVLGVGALAILVAMEIMEYRMKTRLDAIRKDFIAITYRLDRHFREDGDTQRKILAELRLLVERRALERRADA